MKNLPESINEIGLIDLFSQYGTITSYKLMREDSIIVPSSSFNLSSQVEGAVDGKGKCKGFGFVSFENADQAMRALMDLNGRVMGSYASSGGIAKTGKFLVVNIAEPRGYRERKLKMMNAGPGGSNTVHISPIAY